MPDYGSMSIDELEDVYEGIFGDYYSVNWDANLEDWRDDMIRCIEEGTPQDADDPKYPWNHPLPPGAIS